MEEQIQKLEIDVSIIIVNYNSTEFLKDCLDSIEKFTTGINFEIIVIDNNSMTGDFDELLKYHDKITLIKGKNILLLNNDTLLIENSIKKVFDFAESLEGENIIGCKLLNEDKSTQKSVYDFPIFLNVFTSNFFLYLLFPKSKYFNKYHLMNKGISRITEVDVVTGAFIFMSRKSYEALGGFDERFFFYMDDTDLCYRHKQNIGKVIYFPETSIIHLKGKSVKGESWFKNKHQSISTIKFFQKHFFGLEFLLMLIFHYIGLLLRFPLFILGGMFTLNKNLFIRGIYYARLIFLYPANQFKS
ncbi:MAG: glycosyltransferase family 2 protein [Ignavibacteriaceae bacterium]|nr:glycosyltransferase family 2 protein [Ignavibacteriaceae bacterium]